jgi:hypothetical protein
MSKRDRNKALEQGGQIAEAAMKSQVRIWWHGEAHMRKILSSHELIDTCPFTASNAQVYMSPIHTSKTSLAAYEGEASFVSPSNAAAFYYCAGFYAGYNSQVIYHT